MPFDDRFADALVEAISNTGWKTSLPAAPLPNPLRLNLVGDRRQRELIVHARPLTSQAGHNRPEDELHAQMIFDGDGRGKGARNHLRFAEGAVTLLLGFYEVDDGYVVAAYDPDFHREYAYSKSLQLKQADINRAQQIGIHVKTRKNGEQVVIFSVEEIMGYIEVQDQIHDLRSDDIVQMKTDAAFPLAGHFAFENEDDRFATLQQSTLPELQPAARRQNFQEVSRYVRDYKFAQGIKEIYEHQCATCDFQYDFLIEAAHIVPVADGGTDTYDNGIGLCPNCHQLFDRGLLLVDEEGRVFLNQHRAEQYIDAGLAASLERIQSHLREYIRRPDDTKHQPSPENLRTVFNSRSRVE